LTPPPPSASAVYTYNIRNSPEKVAFKVLDPSGTTYGAGGPQYDMLKTLDRARVLEEFFVHRKVTRRFDAERAAGRPVPDMIKLLSAHELPNSSRGLPGRPLPGRPTYELVCDLAEGGTLLDSIAAHGHVYTEAHAQSAFRDIARNIQFLHDTNIVHRDLKLDNIMCLRAGDDGSITAPRETWSVCDFGLAVDLDGRRGVDYYTGAPVADTRNGRLAHQI
jgi:serine/threonine protein kinase